MNQQEAWQLWREADTIHSEAEVDQALERLAEELEQRVGQSMPLMVCVLNGGLIVAGRLLNRLRFPLQIDSIRASRYRNETSGGKLELHHLPQHPLTGRCVVLIDDIYDEGYTLNAIADWVRQQGAAKVVTLALVEKLHDRKAPGGTIDLVGLRSPDRFLFGCGMDYQGFWRNSGAIHAPKGL